MILARKIDTFYKLLPETLGCLEMYYDFEDVFFGKLWTHPVTGEIHSDQMSMQGMAY